VGALAVQPSAAEWAELDKIADQVAGNRYAGVCTQPGAAALNSSGLVVTASIDSACIAGCLSCSIEALPRAGQCAEPAATVPSALSFVLSSVLGLRRVRRATFLCAAARMGPGGAAAQC
jgi:hypothetical protein